MFNSQGFFLFCLSSWGVPLIITVAAVCLNKIGYDASEVSVGWCWVRINAPDRVLWMLLTGKIWEFLAYLTLPVLYVLIKRHIHIAVRTTPGFIFYREKSPLKLLRQQLESAPTAESCTYFIFLPP